MSLVEESSKSSLYFVDNCIWIGCIKLWLLKREYFVQNSQNLIYISRLQKKINKKVFCFLDNCTWNGCVKLPVSRKEYLSSAVNVLKTAVRFYIFLRETFIDLIAFSVINQYGKDAIVEISTVLGTVYHVACRRFFWSRSLPNQVFRSR